jgi:hypothetical protein
MIYRLSIDADVKSIAGWSDSSSVESIDNLSTESRNLSTGVPIKPQNRPIINRPTCGIDRPGGHCMFPESTDNPPIFRRNLPIRCCRDTAESSSNRQLIQRNLQSGRSESIGNPSKESRNPSNDTTLCPPAIRKLIVKPFGVILKSATCQHHRNRQLIVRCMLRIVRSSRNGNRGHLENEAHAPASLESSDNRPTHPGNRPIHNNDHHHHHVHDHGHHGEQDDEREHEREHVHEHDDERAGDNNVNFNNVINSNTSSSSSSSGGGSGGGGGGGGGATFMKAERQAK